MAVRVGVDFGTTHTLVALADQGNFPVLSLPFDYEGESLVCDHVPTAVTLHQGRLYYGPAATTCFLEHFEDGAFLVPSIKRTLQSWHEGQHLSLGRTSLPTTELLTGFLTEIKSAILKALDLDQAEIEAVIAVPANASSSQRYVTLACFRQAGFKVLRILDEPCASGIQFVRERYKRWDKVEADVVIYDLGGGTFDTTLLSIQRDRYDPVLSRGISRLGGDDFDEVLLKLVEDDLGQTFTGRERVEMLQAVRNAKENIGPYTQKLHLDTRRGVASVSVKAFQDAAQPLLERTLDLVEKVLADTVGRSQPPDRIVLVGGGSLLPLVPKTLRDRFGRAKIHQGLYPFAAVAIGAAVKSASPELEVQDRLNHNFGVVRVREDGSEYVDVIFEKGCKLPEPGQNRQVRRPAYDPRYNIGCFRYLECGDVDPDSGLACGETVHWNEILFPYDQALNPDGQAPTDLRRTPIEPTDRLRQERILEEYSLDEFGIITTRISRTVQDRYSGCYNLFRLGPS
jgi:molecular chaperone DnaK (HSP70)